MPLKYTRFASRAGVGSRKPFVFPVFEEDAPLLAEEEEAGADSWYRKLTTSTLHAAPPGRSTSPSRFRSAYSVLRPASVLTSSLVSLLPDARRIRNFDFAEVKVGGGASNSRSDSSLSSRSKVVRLDSPLVSKMRHKPAHVLIPLPPNLISSSFPHSQLVKSACRIRLPRKSTKTRRRRFSKPRIEVILLLARFKCVRCVREESSEI